MDQFEIPFWSTMVEPTGMKRVRLIWEGGETFAPGKGEHMYSHNSYKIGSLDLCTAGRRTVNASGSRRRNGAILECSDETPFALQEGSTRMAGDMMGLEVLTDSHGPSCSS
jgi:hypothetical protein